MRDTSSELLRMLDRAHDLDQSSVILSLDLATAVHRELTSQSIAISKVKIICHKATKASKVLTPFTILKILKEELGDESRDPLPTPEGPAIL